MNIWAFIFFTFTSLAVAGSEIGYQDTSTDWRKCVSNTDALLRVVSRGVARHPENLQFDYRKDPQDIQRKLAYRELTQGGDPLRVPKHYGYLPRVEGGIIGKTVAAMHQPDFMYKQLSIGEVLSYRKPSHLRPWKLVLDTGIRGPVVLTANNTERLKIIPSKLVSFTEEVEASANREMARQILLAMRKERREAELQVTFKPGTKTATEKAFKEAGGNVINDGWIKYETTVEVSREAMPKVISIIPKLEGVTQITVRPSY